MVDTANKFSLWAIEIFVASVEEGSISAAAKRLNSSNSTVSQQLTNLELALGSELLDRSTRPMKLKPTGQLFLHRARAILSEVMQAKSELAQFDHSQMVRLRLGVIDDFDADVTPTLMKALAKRMTNCQFLLQSGQSFALADELHSRTLDMVISADLERAPDWMEVHPLITEPFVVAAPKGAIDQSGNVRQQLFDMSFIRHSSRAVMGQQIETHLTRQRIRLPNQFEFNNYHAILSMVADKTGWTITTPLGFLRARRFAEDIELMPLPFDPMSRTISLNARKDAMVKMPKEVANTVRPIIQEQVIIPMVKQVPWLRDSFRLLG
jgi:DNA-binding transcriptional LysR family regulator